MNRLEIENRSEQCMQINDDATTVFMPNAASVGA
jgi:hypothetical protein